MFLLSFYYSGTVWTWSISCNPCPASYRRGVAVPSASTTWRLYTHNHVHLLLLPSATRNHARTYLAHFLRAFKKQMRELNVHYRLAPSLGVFWNQMRELHMHCYPTQFHKNPMKELPVR